MTALRHGWSAADVDRIASWASAGHPARSMPPQDRRDTAWEAIVVAILEAPGRPSELDMLHAGRDAISRAAAAELREHGLSWRDRGQMSPAFTRYWHMPVSPWEDSVVERHAVAQIWAALPAHHRAVLEALAIHGTYPAAARSLGTTDVTFRSRLAKARAAFRHWWHEHEEPSAMWGADRRGEPVREKAVTHVMRAKAHSRELAARGSEAA